MMLPIKMLDRKINIRMTFAEFDASGLTAFKMSEVKVAAANAPFPRIFVLKDF